MGRCHLILLFNRFDGGQHLVMCAALLEAPADLDRHVLVNLPAHEGLQAIQNILLVDALGLAQQIDEQGAI
jgi:hypothetical protein